jgi:SAM-dependent methyltransferase
VAWAYDRLGDRYDSWSRSVTEDIAFYVDLAVECGGPVLEIGVGSGRVAIPIALAGVTVVGVDRSPVLLDLCRRKAAPHHVDIRLHEADMRDLPDLGRFPLVIVPFRAFLHLRDDEERLAVLRALRDRLEPGGTLAFDVFHPDARDIEETHGRWIPRDGEVLERADWEPSERRLTLSVRAPETEARMELWWVEPAGWRKLLHHAGFGHVECYGWFDRRGLRADATDSVWIARVDPARRLPNEPTSRP